MPEQSGRGEHASRSLWAVHVDRTPWRTAHPDNAGQDLRSSRRPAGSVVPRVDLLRAGQKQGQRVAHALARARRERRGDHDLISAGGVEQPAVQHDGPFEGPGELIVCLQSCTYVRIAFDLVSEAERERAQRADLGQCADLGPVEAWLVGQHGGGRRQSARPQPAKRGLAAPGSRDSREHCRCGQRDEQGKHGERPPALAQLKAQPGQGNSQASSPTFMAPMTADGIHETLVTGDLARVVPGICWCAYHHRFCADRAFLVPF